MTISDVQLSNVGAIPLAVVRRQVRGAQLAAVVPEGCGRVWTFVRAHQLKAGRNVAVYWDSSIRLDVGVELSGPLPADPEIVASATPAGLAASIVHLGPYGQLGTAHDAIHQWCAARGHQLSGVRWEIYGHWLEAWNADPSQIRTDVFYQVEPGAGTR